MSFSVVYSNKDKISEKIASKTIPNESFIITNQEAQDAEIFYYDEKGNLKQITKKTSFNSLADARLWIAKYKGYEGQLISVLTNEKWIPYLVDADLKLHAIPLEEEVITINDTVVIDGGSAEI